MDVNTEKAAVILMNLGTPTEASASAVRKFLREFLGDSRVVEVPRVIWKPLLEGIILPLRCGRVAKLYQQIWTEEGSPLLAITKRQTRRLQESLNPERIKVTYAMTYGAPKLEERVKELTHEGIKKILLLPLYPQYSATTTGAIFDQYAKLILRQRDITDIRVVKNYCTRSDYIEALAKSISEYWTLHSKPQKLLFSFHGIPKRCIDRGDPYQNECVTTANLVAEALNLKNDDWEISYQSRLGKAEWLKPYTDVVLSEFPQLGIRDVHVVCPAFASDCLETLEEIAVENKKTFLDSGGESYEMIPCLNDQPAHIEMMRGIVAEHFGWSTVNKSSSK